jgi:hypothetical protein
MGDEASEGSLEPASTPLDVLRQEESSLFGLLRVLLSGKTLPHLVLIAVLSATFQVLATAGNDVASALGFLSLSGGYLLTGLMAGVGPVQRWIQLPEETEEPTSGRLKGLILSFRICVFPLVMATVVFGVLQALIGSQGALGDLTDALPLVLSSCFVIASMAASRLPEGEPREEGLPLGSTVSSLFIIVVLASVLLIGFEWLADTSTSPAEGLLANTVFFVVVLVVFAMAWRRSMGARLQASTRADFHRFSSRWMLLTQLMITWHLLTVWRHWAIAPGGAMLFVEEFLLMIFTVVMAIWGLTSKSYRSSLRLVTSQNALPMGLAFGYAYAGSVAMLTTVLHDVRNVMMAGHLLVVLTFLWMQPRVLQSTMGGMESTERIKQVVNEAVPATEASLASDSSGDSTVMVGANDASDAEVLPTPVGMSEQADAGSAAVREMADASSSVNEQAAIGEDVSWSEPEVLAGDVAWDDDEIELLD